MFACEGDLSMDQCQHHFATEQDYDQYVEAQQAKGEEALPAHDFMLPPAVAFQRKQLLDDSSQGAYTSNVLNASPGEVIAANDQLVQYKCSTLPQMSGAPCKS